MLPHGVFFFCVHETTVCVACVFVWRVCLCVRLQSFDSLISTVEQTGSTRNEIRRTEGLIDTLQERNTNLNMDRVQADLDAIKAENTQLAKRLGIKK